MSESGNATLNIIDTTINRSMEFVSTAINQVLQLIFCLLAVVTFARLVNILIPRRSEESIAIAPKTPPAPESATNEKEKAENEEKIEPKIDTKEDKKLLSGWESESIVDSPQPQLEVPQKVIKQQLKIPKRKCISVGPVMLTPHSQIIRKFNVEEREERYRYDILPLNSPHVTNQTAEAQQAVVDIINVCVFCFLNIIFIINISIFFL